MLSGSRVGILVRIDATSFFEFFITFSNYWWAKMVEKTGQKQK
jgi:hypothetical protein